MAIEVLASARGALEAARGTDTTPTRILYFENATHDQDVGTLIPPESWANYTPHRRAYPGLEANKMHFDGDVTTGQIVFWLNLAVDAEATGSVTDTSAYTWPFLPVHTSDALKSATIQFAYADLLASVGWKLPGLLCERFATTWTKPASGAETGVKYEIDLVSASAATQITAFTGSLSDIAMRSFVGNNTKTYIDTTAAAFGATADTRVNQATFEVIYGYQPRFGFDGLGNAIELVRTGRRMSRLTIQRYFNNVTELNHYINKTSKRIRILNEGAVVGAATAKETLQLDYGGVSEVHSKTMSDGMVFANIEYAPMDDSSISSDFKFTVINTASAVT